jgi:hypothetical protein
VKVPRKSRALQALVALNLRQFHQDATTCLTYRNTASAPTDGNVQMSSRGACFNGWKNPASAGKLAYRKRVRSLYLAIAISREGDTWAAFARWFEGGRSDEMR